MKLLNRFLGAAALLGIVGVFGTSVISAQSATECEAGFRLFDHELLATDPVCIPENPQRIVALEAAAAELLLFTDKENVGTFDVYLTDEMSATLPVLADEYGAIPGLGWPLNLEQVLELAPDLIATYENETMPYETLSQVAPTVIFSAGIAQGNWQTATQFWSEVFNVQSVYEEMASTYDARVAELQEALGEDRGDIEVSTVLASSYFNMINTTDSPLGRILQDVGLGRPASQALNSEESFAAYGNETYAYLSDETLNLADGDVIFVYTFAVSGDEAVAASDQYLEDFQANPLWQSLSGVQAGNSYAVGFHWTRANTYLLANAILDDLFTFLTDTQSTIPNPIEAFSEAEAGAEAEAEIEVTPEATAETSS